MATLGGIMSNLAILLIRNDLTGSLSETAKLAIARAIDHYKSERFWFSEGRISLSTSASVSEYTLSASTLAIISVNITANGSTYPIDAISETDRLSHHSANLTGTPSYYSVFANRFIPYPTPNTAYTVEIACTRDQGTLTAESQANNWTNHAEQLIEARAAWWLSTYIFKNYEEAQTFAALEGNALDALRGKEVDKSHLRIKPTQF